MMENVRIELGYYDCIPCFSMPWRKLSWSFPGIRRVWEAPGFISIMHTWGSNLSCHPHIHVLCTGGGLDGDRNWHQKKGGFFLPVKAMAALFKGKFLSGLKALHEAGNLSYEGV